MSEDLLNVIEKRMIEIKKALIKKENTDKEKLMLELIERKLQMIEDSKEKQKIKKLGG